MNWLRWHHGTSTDPKWRVIAAKSGAPLAVVLSIWATLLESASESEDRGTLSGWVPDEVGAALDVTPEQVQAVYEAMQGRTLDGNRLTGWEKRQVHRERDDHSTERVQRHRETKKTKEHHETPGNATKHPDKRRLEEKREEKKHTEAPAAFCVTESDFQDRWRKYPNPKGRKEALRHFAASIESPQDMIDFDAALENYRNTRAVENVHRRQSGRDAIPWQNGSTWFNNWRDWIPQVVEPENEPPHGAIDDEWKPGQHQCKFCERAHDWPCDDRICTRKHEAPCVTWIREFESLKATVP